MPAAGALERPGSEAEDCLYLNVFRPAGARRGAKLPVLFWIHGGGLTNGSGDQHDGTLMAHENDIVVVSINYRLGVFGFLGLPGADGESPGSSGDYGLLDQEAALRWVHRNIAAFGGDPGRVTIAGESAGGCSVCALLTSPPARGLFHGAIIQSGSCTRRPAGRARPPDRVRRRRGLRRPRHRRVPACGRRRGELLGHAGYPPLPLTGAARAAAAPAAARRRWPLRARSGADRHQPRRGPDVHPGLRRPDGAAVRALVREQLRRERRRSCAHYPWSAYPPRTPRPTRSARSGPTAASSAGIGGCPTRDLAAQLARHADLLLPVRRPHAPGLNHDLPGYQWGAGHAMELAYMWPSFDNGYPAVPAAHPGPAAALRADGAVLGRLHPAGVPPQRASRPGRRTRAGG